MRPERQPQQFTARGKDEEVFQAIAVSPVTGGAGLASVAVVVESSSQENAHAEILLLRPCYGGFMVPQVIARAYDKVTKLMWDNVTWVGLGRQVKTVSCLVAATEHDVSVGEVIRGGLSGVCRVRFRASARDCVFLAWVPRVVYVTREGVGAIDFSFEAQITVTKHTYSVFLHQDEDTPDTSQDNQAQHVTAAALTCLAVLDKRSEVLVGDNRGMIYVYRTDTSRFSKHRQLTFSFPLTEIAVYASRSSLFLAGVPDPLQDSATAGILRLDRTNLTASPEYQPLGQGRVLGLSWCLDPRPLLTIIEENTGLVHHKAQDTESPVMAFAAKPVTLVSRVAWGSDGWLGYVTADEVVLEREPAILTTPDE